MLLARFVPKPRDEQTRHRERARDQASEEREKIAKRALCARELSQAGLWKGQPREALPACSRREASASRIRKGAHTIGRCRTESTERQPDRNIRGPVPTSAGPPVLLHLKAVCAVAKRPIPCLDTAVVTQQLLAFRLEL